MQSDGSMFAFSFLPTLTRFLEPCGHSHTGLSCFNAVAEVNTRQRQAHVVSFPRLEHLPIIEEGDKLLDSRYLNKSLSIVVDPSYFAIVPTPNSFILHIYRALSLRPWL
ncbi:unnamed protein product [Pylaiella littoralis]